VLVVFFRNLRHPTEGGVPWRQLVRELVVVLVAAVVSFASMTPQYLLGYTTDKPFWTFVWTRVIALSLGSVLLYSVAVLLFGLAMLFLARAYGAESLPRWRGMPAVYYRDVVWVGLCGSATLAALPRVVFLVRQHWPVARFAIDATVPQGLDASWPAAAELAATVLRSFLVVGGLALVLGFAACYLRRTWMQAALLVALAVLLVPRWVSGTDFVESALLLLLEIAVIWWGASRLVRFNLLGYMLVAMLLSLAAGAAELLQQPNSIFRMNGWALVAAMALLLGWPLIAWLGGRKVAEPGL
jgi:hypothetical protein